MMEKVIISENIICPNCAAVHLEAVLKRKYGAWFIFECGKCGAEIPAITLPDSNYWAIFVERVKWEPPKELEK